MQDDLSINFKNILVTGGGGFIGGNFIRKIIHRDGINVFNVDKINYCTDNAAMIAMSGKFMEEKGYFADLSTSASARIPMD